MSDIAIDRPESAPDGAESLPGVLDLYARFDAAKAKAKATNPADDPEAWAEYDAVSAELRVERKRWREIKEYLYAVATAEWEATQPPPVDEPEPEEG